MTGPDWRTDLDAWRLDRAWDDLPRGQPMPPEMSLTEGISKFYEDGSTIEPTAGFVARLEEEIMGVHHVPADKVVAPVAVLPTLAPLPVLATPPRARKSWPVVDVAMLLLIAGAVAAFVALQSGAFTLSSRDGDDGPPLPQISGGPATNGLPAIAATPAATPALEDCTIQPRTIEEVISIVGIAGPRQWDEPYSRSFPSSPTTVVRPTGEPAPPPVIDEIQFILDQFVACAPYETRLSAMWIASEGAIKRDLNNPLTSDIIAALQDPTAYPQPPVAPTGVEIERADLLADGRVVVDYVIVVPPGSGIDPAELEATSIFVNEDGLWRIDEEVDTGTIDPLAPATPSSGFTRESLAPSGTPPAGG